MLQHLASTQVTKNKTTRVDSMNSVTIYYIWLKCYLNLFNIVAAGMRGCNQLAIALNKILLFLEKNIRNYSDFLSIITGSLSLTLTSQTNFCSSESSIIPAISDGIVVLNDFERGFCRIIFDFTSNNFIHSYLSFVINIFDNIV